jgi:virulence factor
VPPNDTSHSEEKSYGFKVGVIGCGQITRRVYAPILLGLAGQVEVAAVCDLNEPSARSLATGHFPGAGVYTDVSPMLRKEKLDAVMVLTSETANASTARKVLLESDVPIYLEKPPARTLNELDNLMETESRGPARIYAAFNRRHTPLFQQISLPSSPLIKVTGMMTRVGREVATFPFTCVHLLDSTQFFSRSRFATVRVDFERKGKAAWKLGGQLENGAGCELTFNPDGERENEYLIFETKDERWEAHFPDSDGKAPKVRLVLEKGPGRREETADASQGIWEVMGYAPCFRHFVRHLQSGDLATSAHRLESCRRTIEVLEAMDASFLRAVA